MGIGITNPESRLTVNGSIRIKSGGELLSEGADFIVKDNGFVGIGTTNPVKKLNISSNLADYITLLRNENDNGEGILIQAGTGGLRFPLNVQNKANVALLAVRDDGYVGIGTTNPQTTLDVNGNVSISTHLLMSPSLWITPSYDKIKMKFIDYTLPDGNSPAVLSAGAWISFLYANFAIVSDDPTNDRYTYSGAWKRATTTNIPSNFFSPTGAILSNFTFRRSSDGAAYFLNNTGGEIRVVGTIYFY